MTDTEGRQKPEMCDASSAPTGLPFMERQTRRSPPPLRSQLLTLFFSASSPAASAPPRQDPRPSRACPLAPTRTGRGATHPAPGALTSAPSALRGFDVAL